MRTRLSSLIVITLGAGCFALSTPAQKLAPQQSVFGNTLMTERELATGDKSRVLLDQAAKLAKLTPNVCDSF